MNILDGLNDIQKQAVQHTEGALLILAGAGSGKTRVITQRIAWLIHKGVSPANILAVTFTNKAADEMRQRVAKLLKTSHSRPKSQQPASLYLPLISTFHSFCVRVLRQDIDKINHRRDFIIYDDTEQESLLKECLKELRIDEKKFKLSVFADLINKAKDDLVDFESYQIYTAASGDYYRGIVSEVYKLYQLKLSRNNALDFGDLIMKTVQLWKEHKNILEKYQDRFRYIMVDEYQDTNHAQYMMTKLLAHKYQNICVVGDEDQSIYMWRGADMRNILHFEKDYAKPTSRVSVLKMMDNYRSPQSILDVANNLIGHNSQRRHDKGILVSVGHPKRKEATVQGQDLLNEIEEARYVVGEIKQLINKEKVRGNHIAIFYRTNAQSRVFEDALRENKLDYAIIGSVKFYDRKEIKDILAYLRLIINPADSLALKRIINVPNRGLGKVSLEQVEAFARQRGIPLYEALLNIEKTGKIQKAKIKISQDFISLVEKFRVQAASPASVSEITTALIQEAGYIKMLQEEDTLEAQGRLENVQELISAMREFEERAPHKNVAFFLEQISLIDNIGAVPEGDMVEINKEHTAGEDLRDKVVLMTLHLAKGLEFDYVFITGLEEGLLPHLNSMNSEQELEEERRLCYVGMTRAKKRLYLTCASERRLYGTRRWNLPSRFINESGIDLGFARRFSEGDAASEMDNEFDGVDDLWRIGQKVHHPTFGDGKIVEKSGSGDDLKMVILFSDGQRKKVMAKYAHLEAD
ncbi:MAG: UvrD-helicase domain-containing protein [bacterium]